MDLIYTGEQDVHLSGNPEASLFKSIYVRSTNFAISTFKTYFDKSGCVRVSKRGDLLSKCYITLEDSNGNLTPSPSWFGLFDTVDLYIGEQLIDSQDFVYSSIIWPSIESKNLSEGVVPQSFYPLHFFFCNEWGTSLPLNAINMHNIDIRIRNLKNGYRPVLWATYIHLGEQERRVVPSEMIITQVQRVPISNRTDFTDLIGNVKYIAGICPPISYMLNSNILSVTEASYSLRSIIGDWTKAVRVVKMSIFPPRLKETYYGSNFNTQTASSGSAVTNGTYTTIATRDGRAPAPFGSLYWQVYGSIYSAADGSYTGSTTTTDIYTGTVYRGEYAQIQLPIQIVSTGFTVDGQSYGGIRALKLFGSNDGTNWYLINESYDVYKSPNKVITESSYFRLVITKGYAYGGCVPSLTGVSIIGYISGTLVYPPRMMTGASTAMDGYFVNNSYVGSGTYVASASSTTSGYDAYKAFDKASYSRDGDEHEWAGANGSYSVTPDYVYNNRGASTAGKAGEWLQIQCPVAFVADLITITSPWNVGGPRTFVFFGSNDGTNWTNLYETSGPTNLSAAASFQSFQFVNTVAYRYFRLVLTTAYTTYGQVGELVISAKNIVSYPPSPVTQTDDNPSTQILTGTFGYGSYTISASSSAGSPSRPTGAFALYGSQWAVQYTVSISGGDPRVKGPSPGAPSTTAGSTTYTGEYWQVVLPYQIRLKQITYSSSYIPRIVWLASNDGSSFSLIKDHTDSGGGEQTINSALTGLYSIIRAVVLSGFEFGDNNCFPQFRALKLNGNSPSDISQTDFYADYLGNLSTAPISGQSLEDWLGGNTAFVTKWYDQSSKGNDLSNSIITYSPTINTKTSPYSLNFDGFYSNIYNSNFSFNFSPNYSYSIRTVVDNTAGGCLLYKGTNSAQWNASGQKKWYFADKNFGETSTGGYPSYVEYNGGYIYGNNEIPNTKSSVTWISSALKSVSIYENAVPINVTYNSRTSQTSDVGTYLYLGRGGNASDYRGNVYELQIFSVPLSTLDVSILG